ncbi:MAG: PspC domain-containing protein [Acidimicrobiia bacterium]|nr:PspC domain-containing protein [Acidimicrobiia bacterium]
MTCRRCTREIEADSQYCRFCGAAAAAGERRRLMRSVTDRRIAGVCGGIADYMNIDPTIVRLAWVVLSIWPGAIICGVIAYAVAWLVIPEAPSPSFTPATSTP